MSVRRFISEKEHSPGNLIQIFFIQSDRFLSLRQLLFQLLLRLCQFFRHHIETGFCRDSRRFLGAF